MADEKKYTPREVALAVLAKAQEMLAKSELAPKPAAKVAEHQSGLHQVAYYSSQPFEKSESLDFGFEPFQEMQKAEKGVHGPGYWGMETTKETGTSSAGLSHRLGDTKGAKRSHQEKLGELKDMPKPNLPKSEVIKAENPDEKQDAQLGEDVEGLCERHMLENKGAERKEGHKIVKAEMCKMCKSGLKKYEGENPHLENEIGTKIQKSEFTELYSILEDLKKAEGQGSGIKKEPSSDENAPSEEKAPQRDAANFETQAGHAEKPEDHREAPQAAPEANPAEQKEGNNPPAGSVPGKGVHKLSFFMGHRHHKRNGMKKGIALG